MPKLPGSLVALLTLLRPAFTAPSFETLCALVVGFVSRVGEHTVTGMWQAARLAGVVHHSRAHDFFSRARWSPDALGLSLLDFLVAVFVPRDGAVRLAVDDTLFGRSGRKVFGGFFHHDPHAPAGGRGIRFGNCWVCLGLLVRLPMVPQRAICLPLLFRLYRPSRPGAQRPSKSQLGRELAGLVLARYAGRRIELVADAAYASRALAALPGQATVTVRLRRDAALYAPTPPRTGRPGRPRKKGDRLPALSELAVQRAWQPTTVSRYGKSAQVETLAIDCLWYSVFGEEPVRVLLAREPDRADGFDVALLTTDTQATAEDTIARYAERWAIEVCFQDAKQVIGVGEARNRSERAVLRTVPFGFLCQTLVVAWYALCGEAQADVERRRRRAPWYRDKRAPAFADMLTSLRRELIRTQYSPGTPRQPTHRQFTQPSEPPSRMAA